MEATLTKSCISGYLQSIASKWWVGILGYFAPIQHLFWVAMAFISIDFVIGCIASYKRVTKKGKQWAFSSSAAYLTLCKLVLCWMGIGMGWVLATHVFAPVLDASWLPNAFCAVICVNELWSFLENATYISESPIFDALRRITINKAKKYDDLISDDIIDNLTKKNHGKKQVSKKG